MKPLDKKDMPKLIALIGLTVCSLGYGVFTLVAGVSYGQPAPQAKPEEKKDAPPAGTTPETAAATENPMMAELDTLAKVSDPVVVRDPFITRVLPGVTPTPAPGAAPGPAAPTVSVGGLPPVQKTDPTAQKKAKSLARALGIDTDARPEKSPQVVSELVAPAVDPLVIPSPPPPAVEVSGVMVAEAEDTKSVALLRIDGRARWVSLGDSVGNGFVVRTIRRTDRGSEVEIVDSHNAKRRYTFKVN